MKMIKLGDLFLRKGKSVDPSRYPDKTFQLFSIPAYDKSQPEILKGGEIGSSKKALEPNDVVLSRIVPHIRRCWIIPPTDGNSQIGSGEWIVFRSDKVQPSFLRYYLLSDEFNGKFMSTVKGVGGSLLRADPQQVAKFDFPLPPLEDQKRIAALLDAADALRQKDKALIAKYEELTQSLFLDMFGDPVTNPKGWDNVSLNKLCSFTKKNVKPEEILDGTTYIGLEHIEKETGALITKQVVKAGELLSNKFWFNNSYILYGKLRPYLNKVALPKFDGICSTDIIPVLPLLHKTNRAFIATIMKSKGFVSFANERTSGANLPRISPKEIQNFPTINPPIKLQNQFAERVEQIEQQKHLAQQSLQKSEELFNSLLQRAFKGELIQKAVLA